MLAWIVQRFHPFVLGHVASGTIIGALIANLVLARPELPWGYGALGVGTAISAVVCYWRPGLDAAAWKLWLVAVLANPLAIADLILAVSVADCHVSHGCMALIMASYAFLIFLVPPAVGLLCRHVARRRT